MALSRLRESEKNYQMAYKPGSVPRRVMTIHLGVMLP